jgi:hypothetical protein
MLTVVGWLWRNADCMTQYGVEHAKTWARMIDRHLTLPHRFVLATDYPREKWNEFDPLIEPLELWDDWRELKNKTWGQQRPHCYVRLKAFSGKAREFFGDRFVSIDLDCVVIKNLDALFDRDEDFLIFRRQQLTPKDKLNFYQGSMWMMHAGAREFIWTDFKGEESIRAAAGYMGSDQAWLRHRLSPDEAGWTAEDGVYGLPQLLRQGFDSQPPENARIVFFYDAKKPWDYLREPVLPPRCGQCGATITVKPPYQLVKPSHPFPWIAENYQ